MPLLALPNELLLNVTQFLTRPRDIYNLLLTSRYFAGLLLPVIHKCAIEDKDEFTALQWAALKGHEGLARFMIKRGVDVNYRALSTGTRANTPSESALFLAIGGRHPEKLTKILLDGGADITMKGYWGGDTVLHIAVFSGHESVVKLLLDRGADVSAVNDDGQTPLYAASAGPNPLILSLLLSRGALVHVVSRLNETPLHAVAMCNWLGSTTIAKILLENGANINFRNHSGSTPLHIAALAIGCDEIVELFLQHGADVTIRDAAGRTPLHLAAARFSPSLVKLLLQYGASLTSQDFAGHTPIDGTVIGAARDSPGAGIEATIRALLCQGSSIYSSRILDEQLFFWAGKNGYEDILRMTLEQGVNVNTQDLNGLTLLHWAAVFGKVEIVRLLLEKRADESITSEGKTALALAAACGEGRVVELLIENGTRRTAKEKRPSAHGSTRGQVLDINPMGD